MNPDELDEAFEKIEFESDDRSPGDENRRSRFLGGWRDASERDRQYDTKPLQSLTWQNLGYRMGKIFGPQEEAEIHVAFDHFKSKQDGKSGGPWTEDELRAAVAAYHSMLADEITGKDINKAEVRRSLIEYGKPLHGRSEASIEYRMQNISFVLEELGLPRIEGYRPAKNVGANTVARIVRILDELGHLSEVCEPTADDKALDARTKALRKKGFASPPKGQAKPKQVGASEHQIFVRDPAVRAFVLEQAGASVSFVASAVHF